MGIDGWDRWLDGAAMGALIGAVPASWNLVFSADPGVSVLVFGHLLPAWRGDGPLSGLAMIGGSALLGALATGWAGSLLQRRSMAGFLVPLALTQTLALLLDFCLARDVYRGGCSQAVWVQPVGYFVAPTTAAGLAGLAWTAHAWSAIRGRAPPWLAITGLLALQPLAWITAETVFVWGLRLVLSLARV